MLTDRYQQDLLLCNHCRCSFCMAECPTYKENKVEGVGPMGRMQIIQGFYEGYVEPSTEMYDRLSNCARCMYCTVRCPTQANKLDERFDVRIDPAGTTDVALADLVQQGYAPPPVRGLEEMVREHHNIFGRPNDERDRWLSAVEDLPEHRYHRDQAEVLYFVGCVSAFPDDLKGVSAAFAKVLEESGTDFAIVGGDEWCCGYRPRAVGLVAEAEAMKAHNIEIVKKLRAKKVVFNCPSCYHIWKTDYQVEGLDLLHSSEFIANLIEQGKLTFKEFDGKITYHDPCDLGRRMGIYDPPRKVIASVPGAEFVELKHNRQAGLCCGGGGGLDVTHSDAVGAIASKLGQEINDTHALVVVDACPQCKRMIEPTTSVPFKDIVELAAELGQFH